MTFAEDFKTSLTTQSLSELFSPGRSNFIAVLVSKPFNKSGLLTAHREKTKMFRILKENCMGEKDDAQFFGKINISSPASSQSNH